jgi:hypothetical protein
LPNPKARLKDQFHEVARFKHLSLRTGEAYWGWIRQVHCFYNKRHPRDMGNAEVEAFLSHLTTQRIAAAATQNLGKLKRPKQALVNTPLCSADIQ